MDDESQTSSEQASFDMLDADLTYLSLLLHTLVKAKPRWEPRIRATRLKRRK